jgi:hypothetical protein
MAVLIGVLAPTYLKYVESSKKTADCTSIGAMMDACEVAAIDAAAKWTTGTIVIDIDVTNLTAKYNATTSTAGADAIAIVKEIAGDADLQTKWHTANFTITATKGTDGKVEFTCAQKTAFQATSEALYSRFE